MITLLVCRYAYTVWLLTGVNPLPHINLALLMMIVFEGLIEGVFVFLIIQVIENMR